MRRWVIGTILAIAFATGAAAQGTEIKDVITRQIEAFEADDFATAFGFASPSIRGLFGTPENFGRMVTQGYPMVWRPADVTYLDLRQERGALAQRVRIQDKAGRFHVLDYFMIETDQGWKINGVQFVSTEEFSA